MTREEKEKKQWTEKVKGEKKEESCLPGLKQITVMCGLRRSHYYKWTHIYTYNLHEENGVCIIVSVDIYIYACRVSQF